MAHCIHFSNPDQEDTLALGKINFAHYKVYILKI